MAVVLVQKFSALDPPPDPDTIGRWTENHPLAGVLILDRCRIQSLPHLFGRAGGGRLRQRAAKALRSLAAVLDERLLLALLHLTQFLVISPEALGDVVIRLDEDRPSHFPNYRLVRRPLDHTSLPLVDTAD